MFEQDRPYHWDAGQPRDRRLVECDSQRHADHRLPQVAAETGAEQSQSQPAHNLIDPKGDSHERMYQSHEPPGNKRCQHPRHQAACTHRSEKPADSADQHHALNSQVEHA